MRTPFGESQRDRVSASDRRETGSDRHNVYPLRDERRAQAVLRPRTGNVSNVIPIRPPEPPRAA